MKDFRKKQQRPRKSSLVYGREAVRQALQDGNSFDRIYVDQQAKDPLLGEIRRLATASQVPVNYVPRVKLDYFNVGDHEGVIAQKSRITYQNLQDVISFVTESGQVPLFLILDGITDIRNIGGIARTAWCCGIHAIIIPDKGVGALNEDAILTSAGALEKIPVCRVNSLMKAVDELHLNGITVFAAEMKGSVPVATADFSIPAAIVMGSEEKGIYPALLKICDTAISIPMQHEFESLNVSVAAGMILYETMRQRMGT
ncbi:23S rRNA (guanosine(2251)-2'-O)-methyltransferase RlmB [Niabella beijingensis]|uniref:23S rRNA (guanosine(2251)-2'-O)-methyltransferase RlmB n=1 Tax=Niabella beijingensis TaxID=2872700 RepID=UPI001CC0BC01|nr:23S rRNA (guanosine(2251)-2'-O)-methyltransferase RlmB [Niabella beijingensis]MBZ4191536.1 23S rRNA (guanosine(2251)-2'-O)-methyltransferase RlmB [Niabella beijingensis]